MEVDFAGKIWTEMEDFRANRVCRRVEPILPFLVNGVERKIRRKRFCHQPIVFPECVAKVPVSLWGSGGWAVFARRCPTVRNRPQPSATVRNRPQPSATVRNRPQSSAIVRNRSREVAMAVPMVSSAKGVTFRAFQRRIASFRVAGVALRNFQHVSRRDTSRFVWQAQYFCDVFRRCVWRPPMSFCMAGATL